MQKQMNLAKWTRVEAGMSMVFGANRPRRVRLDVNAPAESSLSVHDLTTGEIYFLALVKGRDLIEFACEGAFELNVDQADCYIYTVDGDDIAFQKTDERIFTKIMQRRQRNPDLERMVQLLNANMTQRMAQHALELEARYERRLAAASVAPAAGVPGAAPGEPVPGQEPSRDAAPAE